MRSFFLLHNNVLSFFFISFFLRTLKRHCHWLTDQLIERDQGVALCSSASTVGGQDSLFPNTGSNQPPWSRPHSCASQSKRTGWRQNISRSSSVSLILSRLIWKCRVSGWELICSRVPDINLDRAGVVNIVNLTPQISPLSAETGHNLRWLHSGLQRQREHTLCQISVLLSTWCW